MISITRIFDILDWILENHDKKEALAVKRNGKWDKFSTRQYVDYAYDLSYGLLFLDYHRGDKIATISNNRPEWNFIDMGIAQIGAVHVPIDITISDDELQYIINHSEAKLLIISDLSTYNKLKHIVPNLKYQIVIYSIDNIEGIKNWKEIVRIGRDNRKMLERDLIRAKERTCPDDLFTIVYTSGTTGCPKGVMLSHHNIISNFLGVQSIQPFNSSHSILSFLPICHIFERSANYLFQYIGASIYYAESYNSIIENLKEIKPHGFVTVPVLLEKIYDKLINSGKNLSWVKKKIYLWSVKIALKFEIKKSDNVFVKLKLKIADLLVYKKWREELGNKLFTIISGGAALQPKIEKLFWAAGIKIQNGYGLTETSPVISANRKDLTDIKLNTVGKPIDNIQIKIAYDGEILAKGPNIMLGYYKDQELTKETIDNEGWFHTGDIGEITQDNFLIITDRKKEIFKLSTGKYIAPCVIENKLRESDFIDQILIAGEGKKFVSAIILPSFTYLSEWCIMKKIYFNSKEDIITDNQIKARISKEIDKSNEKLGQSEKIKQFRLVCDTWSVQTGELTRTFKIKRETILKKYENLLNDIYNRENLEEC